MISIKARDPFTENTLEEITLEMKIPVVMPERIFGEITLEIFRTIR